jgi:hypothetical protein
MQTGKEDTTAWLKYEPTLKTAVPRFHVEVQKAEKITENV